MTDHRTYLAELEQALKGRGLDHVRTAEVVEEVAGHLAESGDEPVEAFGPPERYAAALLAADQIEDAAEGYERRTFRATAFDEMAILADLGLDGWELTGVRDFGLHARRPVEAEPWTAWRYERRTAIRRGPVLAAMEAEGWTPCGRWATFHYFKRPLADPAP